MTQLGPCVPKCETVEIKFRSFTEQWKGARSKEGQIKENEQEEN